MIKCGDGAEPLAGAISGTLSLIQLPVKQQPSVFHVSVLISFSEIWYTVCQVVVTMVTACLCTLITDMYSVDDHEKINFDT